MYCELADVNKNFESNKGNVPVQLYLGSVRYAFLETLATPAMETHYELLPYHLF